MPGTGKTSTINRVLANDEKDKNLTLLSYNAKRFPKLSKFWDKLQSDLKAELGEPEETEDNLTSLEPSEIGAKLQILL